MPDPFAPDPDFHPEAYATLCQIREEVDRRIDLEKRLLLERNRELFGVQNFSRYPQEVLEENLRYWDFPQEEKPIAVVTVADHDNDHKAFTRIGYRSFVGDLKFGYNRLVSEVGAKEELDLLKRITRKHGPISLWSIHAHTEPGGMEFSDDSTHNLVASPESARFLATYADCFTPDAQIVLYGCRTAKGAYSVYNLRKMFLDAFPGRKVYGNSGKVTGVHYRLDDSWRVVGVAFRN